MFICKSDTGFQIDLACSLAAIEFPSIEFRLSDGQTAPYRSSSDSIGPKAYEEDLTIVGELMATGKVTPVIDRRYSLSEIPEALRYLEEGHARGKVAITLEHNNET